MRATLSLVVGLFFYFSGLSAAQAQDGQWTLIESTGSVFVAQPLATPRFVSLKEELAPGSIVTTGGNARAVVQRGEQHITIGPNSRIALPAAAPTGLTKIIQDFGAVMFKVDKRGTQHFEVDTPLIAAVVKGTTFTVSVAANGHSVHVVEGLVEVSTHSGGSPVAVGAGGTAFVFRHDPTVIELIDPRSGSGDIQRRPNTDPGPPAGTLERRADNADATTLASLTIPETIGGGPLDFERLSRGLIASGRTLAITSGADNAGGLTQSNNNARNGASGDNAQSEPMDNSDNNAPGGRGDGGATRSAGNSATGGTGNPGADANSGSNSNPVANQNGGSGGGGNFVNGGGGNNGDKVHAGGNGHGPGTTQAGSHGKPSTMGGLNPNSNGGNPGGVALLVRGSAFGKTK
jgi:hypothetical protein